VAQLRREYSSYNSGTGEYVETQFEHLNLPDNLDTPTINGVERTLNLGIVRAPGWHYTEDGMLFIPAYGKVKGQSINFAISIHPKEGIVFEFNKSKLFASRIPVSDIFTICYNIGDADQIRSLVGSDSMYLTTKFIKQQSMERISKTAKNPKIKDYQDLLTRLRILLTTQTVLTSPHRLYNIAGLSQFEGLRLAEDVEASNVLYTRFTALDREVIFNLEHSGLESITLLTEDSERIQVSIPNELYIKANIKDIGLDNEEQFRKMEIEQNSFSFMGQAYRKEGIPDHNTLSIYCLMINRLLAFNAAGINISMQSYDNQAIRSFSDVVNDFIRSDVEDVESKMANCETMLEGVSGHRFSLNRAEKMIRNADSAMAVLTNSENPLAELSQGRVLVRDVKFLPKEAVSVSPQDLGVIDPVDSSESKSIGKTTPLTVTTEVQDGELRVPLYRVEGGVNTKEVDWVSVGALDELFIGEANCDLKGNVLAKHHGEVKLFPATVVTHLRPSPFSTTSVCRASAVFLENTDQKRTQMAANTQKQARTVLRPKRARVETGIESIVANGAMGKKYKFTVRDIFEDYGITGTDVDDQEFRLEEISNDGLDKEFKVFSSTNPELFALFQVKTVKTPSGAASSYELVPPMNGTSMYQPDEVVYKHHNLHFNSEVIGTDRLDFHTKGDPKYFNYGIGNGVDLLVMFGFYDSYTVDDASLMSDRVIRDLSLATPIVVTKKFELDKLFSDEIEEKLGFTSMSRPEGFSPDGVPFVGTFLRPGSTWLYKYEQNVKSGIITVKNLSLGDSEQGEVVAVEINKKFVTVTFSQWIHVQVGDKFSGREGNKTIVSKVLPAELMPFHPETGRRIDIILNPLGLPSRNNISQLAELQRSAETEARKAAVSIVPPFSNELMKMVRNYEDGKEHTMLHLVNPRTGQYFPQPSFCGYMYFLRSVHIAQNKLHGIGDSTEIDAAFLQPVGGSELHEKGQSISAMEKDCLISYGASGILDEIHSTLSADRVGFKHLSELFEVDGDLSEVEIPLVNFHKDHMQHVLLAFHCTLVQKDGGVQLLYMSDEDMDKFLELDLNDLRNELTRKDYLNTMTVIPFKGKILTPVALRKFDFTSIIPISKVNEHGKKSGGYMSSTIVEQILSGISVFTYDPTGEANPVVIPYDLSEEHRQNLNLTHAPMYDGMADFIKFLEDCSADIWVKKLESRLKHKLSEDGVFDEDLNKKLEKAKSIVSNGGFKRFITTKFPVLPNKYRQAKGEVDTSDSLTAGYKDIGLLSQGYGIPSREGGWRIYRRLAEMMLPSDSNTQRLSLFEFMAKKETGGRIRGKILKTRVLCSLRSTIVPMSGGHPDEIGLPLIGAIRLAQPIVAAFIKQNYHVLCKEGMSDIDLMSYIIEIITLPTDRVARITPWTTNTYDRVQELKKDIKELIDGRYVFYGRAPSLHETSQRGGRCYVHDDKVIHLHSLLTTDMNADHDGDAMYVVMPFTKEAIEDIRTKMLPSVNTLRYNDGEPSLRITQDALLGLFLATQPAKSKVARPIVSIEQVRNLINFNQLGYRDLVILSVEGKLVKSTAGCLILNSILNKLQTLTKAEDGFYTPEVTGVISSSGKGENGISISGLQKSIAASFNSVVATNMYVDLQNFGYEVATNQNMTIGIKDLTPILQIESKNAEIKKYVEISRTLEELGMLPEGAIYDLDSKVKSLIKDLNIMDTLPEDNAYWNLIKSGAKGKEAQALNLFGVIGFVGGNNGKPLSTPILSNLISGLSQFQVEDLSYTQRENAISTVFETSKPGESLRSGSLELAGLVVEANASEIGKEPQLCFYQKKSDKVFVGNSRKEAEELVLPTELMYNGKRITGDTLRQLRGCQYSELEIDNNIKLFFDVELHPLARQYFDNKMSLSGKRVSKDALANKLEELPTHLNLATHLNEFSIEYGIEQAHAGFRMGAVKPYEIGVNIGIKASTATSEPANQLVISKRHGNAGANLTNGIDMFKDAIQNGKFYKNLRGSYEMLAPEDGVITIRITNRDTAIILESVSGKKYVYGIDADKEHFNILCVKTGDLVFAGQAVVKPANMSSGDRLLNPLYSFVWDTVEINGITYRNILPNPSADVVQMIRFYYIIYLHAIYKVNNIDLDLNHYGCFALQATRHGAIVYDQSGKRESGYINLCTYFKEVYCKEESVVVKMLLTNSSTTIMLTAGPVAALCYRDGITVAAKSSIAGSLPEYGATSKVIFGVGLNEDLAQHKLLPDIVDRRKPVVIDEVNYVEPKRFEFTSEEEDVFDDLFAELTGDVGESYGNETAFEGGTEEDEDAAAQAELNALFGVAMPEAKNDDVQSKETKGISVGKSSVFNKE
jgi:DNA-directed RNA polymerase beta subunit